MVSLPKPEIPPTTDLKLAKLSHQSRIPSLDGLRTLSISMVIVGHAAETVNHGKGWEIPLSIAGNGHTGVSIFFVISGFLITGLLLNEERKHGKIDLSRFYVRRSFRILPALYVYLATIGVLGLLGKLPLKAPDLLKAALFVWNYAGGNNWFLGHTWSLSIEEQFYLIWPLILMRLKGKARVWVATGIILASPFIRVATYILFPALRGRIPIMGHTRADMLMFGCMLALLATNEKFGLILDRLERLHLQIVAALYLFVVDALLVQRFTGSYLLPVGYTLEGVCISTILMWAVRNPTHGAARILNAEPIAFLGRISFSLYLWQQLFLTPLNLTCTRKFPLNLICTLVVAILSYSLIERPVLHLRDRLLAPSRTRRTSLEVQAICDSSGPTA